MPGNMQDPGVKTNRAWLADRVRQLLATVRSKHKGSWTSQRVSMPYLKQKVDPNGLCLGHISPRNKLPYTYYLIFSKRGKKKSRRSAYLTNLHVCRVYRSLISLYFRCLKIGFSGFLLSCCHRSISLLRDIETPLDLRYFGAADFMLQERHPVERMFFGAYHSNSKVSRSCYLIGCLRAVPLACETYPGIVLDFHCGITR